MFESTPLPTLGELEADLVRHEAEISRHRAAQLRLLRQLDQAQAPLAAGCRNLAEWTTSRLDVAPETARHLVAAARKIGRWASPTSWLERGEMTLDRAVANADLLTATTDPTDLPGPFQLDITSVRRLASRLRETTRHHQNQIFGDRYVSLQPSLDNSRWKLWGELPGLQGAIVEQALRHRADTFPTLPDGTRPSHPQQTADALVSISEDSLSGQHNTPAVTTPLATIFIDAALAAPTRGKAGAEIANGPRVGPETLDRIRCEGRVEVTVVDGDRPIATSHAAQTIPPKLRRFILWRDNGCAADGCGSRYRLQPHHIRHKANGGTDDPDNLAALCWFHHHVVIHGYGYRIDPTSPPQRLRFLKPEERAPPLAA